jgi:hypothetical protein
VLLAASEPAEREKGARGITVKASAHNMVNWYYRCHSGAPGLLLAFHRIRQEKSAMNDQAPRVITIPAGTGTTTLRVIHDLITFTLCGDQTQRAFSLFFD